jgi:hypothetical protein
MTESVQIEVLVKARNRRVDLLARVLDAVVFSSPSTGRLDPYSIIVRLRGGRELARLAAPSVMKRRHASGG